MKMINELSMGAMESHTRNLLVAILIVLSAAMAGCASNNPRDPLEPFNRGVYAFNDGVDTVLMKPLAQGYRAVLPQFVRTGVGNFFSNLDDITVAINSVLQLKIPQALSDVGRFVVNSTVGLLGLIDVATHFGLEKHSEDFGQTLGYWGIGSGPYLVLPLLGPSSVRDAIGRWVDSYSDVVWREDHIRTRNQFFATRSIHNRSRVLETEKVLEIAAIDEYAFIRDAYLQRRRNLVYDGNPPPEPDYDDEPAVKPRSEVQQPTPGVLKDQFGNVVAGASATTTGGIVPALVEATSAAPPRVVLPTDAVGQTSSTPTPPPVQAPSSLGTALEPAGNAAPAAPVVRVWLSSVPGK
jgi:phospholipid-binding lipoprotein MlaA